LLTGPLAAKEYQTDLVVRNEDDTLGKVKVNTPVFGTVHLASDRGISADPDRGWAPPLGEGDTDKSKGLLRQGHVGVKEVWTEKVQRRAD
jgi:hypothetical protein